MKHSRRIAWVLVGIAITLVFFLWTNGAYACEEENGDGCISENNLIGTMIDNSIYTQEDKREIPTVPNLVFAPLGEYAESKNDGPEFTPLRKITKNKKHFSYEHAFKHYGKAWGKGMCITAGGSY